MSKSMVAGALLGAIRYEYRMQIRTWPLWALPVGVVALMLGTGSYAFKPMHDPSSVSKTIGDTALSMNLLTIVVIGALLADRWIRDQQLGVQELFETLPPSPATRIWGKYLGVTAAAATPLLIIWAVLAARIVWHYGQFSAAGIALGAYIAITLPGLAFVAAFGIACPRLVGLRLYQVLFIGYWFWGNLVPAHLMPTLSGTWLTPVGKYANAALFSHSPHSLLLNGGGTTASGYASIALLVGLSAVLIAGVGLSENRRLR